MRVMTDARRQAILAIATDLFREVGYERASMAMISARLGGSKATLYKYFRSKEELFAAAMLDAMEERGQELTNLLDGSRDDVRHVLCQFGKAYLALVCAQDTLAVTRTAVAEGGQSALGASLYAMGARRGTEEIAAYFVKLQQRGILQAGDPRLMGAQLRGLLEAGIVEPLLYGAKPEFTHDKAIPAAVDAFLRAYLVQPAAGSPIR